MQSPISRNFCDSIVGVTYGTSDYSAISPIDSEQLASTRLKKKRKLAYIDRARMMRNRARKASDLHEKMDEIMNATDVSGEKYADLL